MQKSLVRKGTSALFFTLTILLIAESAYGCSCIILPLTKRFRQSEAIFVGRLAYDYDTAKSSVQNFDEGRPVFEVTKRLKGISKRYVAINLDWDEIAKGGMCPTLVRFEEDKDYLIFAYGDNLTIQSVCSDSRKLNTQSPEWDKHTASEIRKLESFWFRTRARLWPF